MVEREEDILKNKARIYSNNSWFPTDKKEDEALPAPEILVPEHLAPPSIDVLWTTNLTMDQLAEVLRDNNHKWDDPSLIDVLEEDGEEES